MSTGDDYGHCTEENVRKAVGPATSTASILIQLIKGAGC